MPSPMRGTSAAPPLSDPAIVLGLGAFGAKVAERLARERAAQDEGASALDILTFTGSLSASHIAEQTAALAREVLAHERLVESRDRAGGGGDTKLHVLVLAHLAEAEIRQHLGPVLCAVEAALLTRFGPIFERFRTGASRNLVVLPLLAMPHPGAHAEGEAIAVAVRTLADDVAKRAPRDRAIPQLFVIEDVAEFTVLSEHELEQCLRNFTTLLLYALPALENAGRLLHGFEPKEPLATFVCATAELPRAKLREYGENRVALELLDAIADAPREGATLGDLDALEEVELAALDPPDESERDVLDILERYAPKIESDDEPRWYARGESVRERYGPDTGDASKDDAQPPSDPPVGFALEEMRRIEEAWRLLQRRRFDDVVARERRAIEDARDKLLERIAARVDRELWSAPKPEAFRRAAELVQNMERGVSMRLEDAVAARDATRPVPAPSFDAFRDAHASLLDEARRKPDLGRMALIFCLTVAMTVLFLPTLLHALADALGVTPSDWFEPAMREHGAWTSLALGALLTGLSLGSRYRRHVLALREAWHEMWRTLEETITGTHASLLDYFASRLKLSRSVAQVEALLALRSALEGDSERLTLLDRAVRRARATLLERQRALGVTRDANGEEDLRGLVGADGETLVEALVGDAARRDLARALPGDERDIRVADVLARLARDNGYAKRWREEVPFTSLKTLADACGRHAEPVAEWDPFSHPESGDSTVERIASFIRRQARSLKVALNFSGYEASDATGVSALVRGTAVVPAAALEGVRRSLSQESAAGRADVPLSAGVEADRAYYVIAYGDIAEQAVASIRPAPDTSDAALRFEVEGDDDGDPR